VETIGFTVLHTYVGEPGVCGYMEKKLASMGELYVEHTNK
jgi:hypothetical protein